MGQYDDLLRNIKAQIGTGLEKAKQALEGSYNAGTRETLNANALSARRGQLGGGVESALEAKVRARAAGELGAAKSNLEANAANASANLEQNIGTMKIQDQTQRDIANQEMIGNIVGGVAGLLGSAAGSKIGQKVIGGWLGQSA